MEKPRVSATVRKPIKDAVNKLRKKEDRSESEMVAILLEEALTVRGAFLPAPRSAAAQ